METIFAHNPTDVETTDLLGPHLTQDTFIPASQEAEYARIYRLYKLRGDKGKAAKYLDMITSAAIRFTATHQDYHPIS